MDLGLHGRVAIVAASSQGLGKAVALGLAREGARLGLCARTEPVLLKTAEEIRRETLREVLAESLAARKGLTAKEIEESWAGQAPLRRVGRPEEFANVVVFLASERASYVTGVSVAVDGGIVKGLY